MIVIHEMDLAQSEGQDKESFDPDWNLMSLSYASPAFRKICKQEFHHHLNLRNVRRLQGIVF